VPSETVKDAASFLFAVKESTDFQFDDQAVEYLELLETRMFEGLDARGIKGRTRDRVIFYDGMLKGVILNLRKQALHKRTDLQDMNMLTPDGKPKKEN
jgi:hypothetical protein